MSRTTTTMNVGPIAVVGASGFLGSHILRRLSTSGHEVVAISRNGPARHSVTDVRWIKCSIDDQDALSNALRRIRTVIHLATSSTPSSASKNMALDAQRNIVESLQLFDTCVKAGVEAILLASSGGTVYGQAVSIPTPESSQLKPISAYGIAKVAVESYLDVYRRKYGLSCRALRISNAYGPFQDPSKGQGVIAAFLERAIQGEKLKIWGTGMTVRDYVYVDDVADAFESAIKYSGKERAFNIGSGSGTSILELIVSLEKIVGSRLEVEHCVAEAEAVPVSTLDCTLARKELHWHAQTSLEIGLEMTLHSIKANSLN